MKSKLFVGVFIIILTVLGVTFSQNPVSQVNDRLQVGLVLSTSGPAASLGEDFLRAFEMMHEETGQQFDYYLEDSQSFPKTGISAANKLFATKDIDVLVSQQSAVVMPLIDIVEREQVPLIASAIAEDEFALRSDYTFKQYPHASVEAKFAADFAEKQKYQKVAIITVADAFGKAFQKGFEDTFSGEVPFIEEFMVKENDFRSYLSKSRNVDAFYFVGYPPHNVSFLKQRKELGLESIPIISTTHIRSQFVRSQVEELIKNVYATTPLDVLTTDATKDFQESFLARYDTPTDWNASYGYDTVMILNEIVKQRGDPREILLTSEFDGLGGTIIFNQKGELFPKIVVIDASDDMVVYKP